MVGVGILGCGAIGSELAEAICGGQAGNCALVGLYDGSQGVASSLAGRLPIQIRASQSFEEFISAPALGLVVECASPAAARTYAEKVLKADKDLLLMSAGALADSALLESLSRASGERNRRLMIPSGALGGIDAVKAVRHGLEEVTLTTTKRPQALRGAPGFKPWETVEITEAQVVFDGFAREAVELFPANVNVAAILSLAGLGPARTRVKIVADPQAPGNVHEVFARGDFGTMRVTMENRPHARNPRTAYLAVLSLVETLRAACTPGVRVGT